MMTGWPVDRDQSELGRLRPEEVVACAHLPLPAGRVVLISDASWPHSHIGESMVASSRLHVAYFIALLALAAPATVQSQDQQRMLEQMMKNVPAELRSKMEAEMQRQAEEGVVPSRDAPPPH